ncbi:hypothetical protein ABPG75_006409 [Micractinium tetrahymenae]
MPLKHQQPQRVQEDAELDAPLLPEGGAEGAGTPPPAAPDAAAAPAIAPANRSVSVALPTPFRDAAMAPAGSAVPPLAAAGRPPLHPGPPGPPPGPPPKRRGGVLRDKYGRYRTLYDQRARTTVLVNAAGVLERCNEQTLPALYKYVGRSFSATPRQLGFITLACALVQAVCAPIGGLMGHYMNRRVGAHVMAAGCFIWGIMATCFAFTNTVWTGMAFWAFNGVGLGLLLPNAQSLIADYFSALSRGTAFGALYLTSALGGMLGALFATNMGHTHPLGLEGWRVAFIAVGAVSLLIGLLNLLFAVDPRYKLEEPEDLRYRQEPDILAVATPSRMLADIAAVLAVPSFVIVVTQGIVGSTPWNALVFNTLYLQARCALLGFSDFQSSLVAALFLGGTAFGAQLGGFVGDWAAKRYPNHGRVAVAQLSVGLGVPLSVAMFKALPYGSSGGIVALYGVCFTFWGLIISWAGSACTSPIFAEVVPSQLRSLVYSFDRAFEGAVAACGAPIVGWLAEHLGFDSGDSGGGGSGGGGAEADLKRAKALGDAIVICTAVPWALCCLLYSGLHVTYPRDRRLALRSQRTRSGFAPSLPILPVPSVASMPSTDLWEAAPGESPTAAHAGAAGGRPRVTFADARPSRL